MRLAVDRLDSPAGPIVLVAQRGRAGRGRLRRARGPALAACASGASAPSSPCRRVIRWAPSTALRAYLAGQLAALDASAGRRRRHAVPARLLDGAAHHPRGHHLELPPLAAAIGRPAAVRAVGLANGTNPVGIVVPCHRVIGADGSLTGYGGGIARKRWLLEHEGVLLRIGA